MYYVLANSLVENNADRHAFETPAGLWSVVCLCRFLLVFCVGHHVRTGDFLLIPSDTETK